MIQVLIQVEAGTRLKRRYNEKTLEHIETRRIVSPHPYPYPYGFIIGTASEDGDAVDCYVLTGDALKAGAIVECEPVGLLKQLEGDEIDHKVLAALSGQSVSLNQDLLQELRAFITALFARFPALGVTVGPILPREDALRYLEKSQLKEKE